MDFLTLAQIKTKLKYDVDLFDDQFVDLTTELLGYINEAIDDAEALIHSLHEDYFLSNTTIALVSGTDTYSLPSDIYASKIRAIHYNVPGGEKYIIRKMRKLSNTLEFDSTTAAQDGRYRYLVINPSTGIKVKFYPTPQETNSYIELWYIRNAKTLVEETDACDIPEFINFILAHVKWNAARKERVGMNVEIAEKHFIMQKALMEQTLKEMVEDEDSNRIEMDMSFYSDFDSNNNW